MQIDKSKTCCFTGHRKLPKEKIIEMEKQLNGEVNNLIGGGVRTFISGGALGFDQLAASLILFKKETEENIRLIFALPCKNQDAFWSEGQKRQYYYLLAKADQIIYVSEKYTSDCMKKRNYYMVDHAAFCICAQMYETGGTVQTLRYAKKQGLKIINVMG